MAQSDGNSPVKFGIALPMYDLETGRTLRLAEMADFAQRAESLGHGPFLAGERRPSYRGGMTPC